MEIKVACKMISKYARTIMDCKEELRIAEICDFGVEYGFSFETQNKYDNVYWCINKRTGRITCFSPNQDPDKFSKRKQIDIKEAV